MSRRGRSMAAISLFAFQDIITSVCGIVIVIVLLLAIELTSRRATPHATEQHNAAQAVDVSAESQQLEQELAQLTRESTANAELIERSGKLSAVELERRKGTLSQDEARLLEQLESARVAAAELAVRTAEAAARSAADATLRKALASLQAEQRQLEQSIRDEKTSPRVRFAFPRGKERSGVLAVVSQGKILVGPIENAAITDRFESRSESVVARDFLRWARGSQAGGYVLVLIRPSGTDVWDELQTELRGSGLSFGFDLVSEDEEVFERSGGGSPR